MSSKRSCSKSNKKGFTLVELLAVVAILGIVSVIAIGAYNGISNRSKQKAYDSKVSQIETSAAKWARENNIDRTTSISVNKLVVEGYLTADEATENGLSIIKNPKTNENMICKMIEISYKNGEIQTKFIDSKDNCTLAEQALNDTKIKVIAYQKGVTGTAAALNPNSNNILPWTNKAVSLVVSSDAYKDEAQNSRETNPIVSTSFDFSGNSNEKKVIIDNSNPSNKKSNVYSGKAYVDNPDAYYNVFNVDASIILDSNVVVTYRFKDGTTKSRTINVRIDKEEATASVIAESDWVTNTQKVIVKIDDGNGSGARRFYVGVGNAYNAPGVEKVELCDSNGKNCKYEKEYSAPSVGEYNIWTEDMVGNISVNPKNKISVNNVDTSVPSCYFDNIGTMGQNNWYVTAVTPRMHTSTAGISGLYYGISKGTNNPNYKNYVGYNAVGTSTAAKINNDTQGQDYTCYVKSLAGNEAKKTSTIKVDTTPPTITVSPTKQETYVKSQKITITAKDAISGLGNNSKIEYAWSKDKQNEPTVWESIAIPGTENVGDKGPTGDKEVTITGQGMTGEYYLWIKKGTISDVAGNSSVGKNGKSISYGPFKFDNTAPECELKAEGKKGDNDWYTGNVEISFKSTSDVGSGVKSYGINSTTGSKTASLTSDTSSKTYTGYIEDKAGNKSSCSIIVKRDTESPSCELQATGTKGDDGWYKSDIKVSFKSATDTKSGVDKKGINGIDKDDTLDVYTETDTKGETYTGHVKDKAGNTGTCKATYKIDKTAPSCSIKISSGTLGNNYWYVSDNVTIEFDGKVTDARSGVSGYGLSSDGKANYKDNKITHTADTTGITYIGYAIDKAGNTTTCGSVTFKKDSTKPSCSLKTNCSAIGTKVSNTTDKYWCKSSTVDVEFATTNDATSGIVKKVISTEGEAEAKDSIFSNIPDTGANGKSYTGYVEDEAGHKADCELTVYKDSIAPAESLCTSTYLKESVAEGTEAGRNDWYRGDVTITSTDKDVSYFTVNNEGSYTGSYTIESEGEHEINITLYDAAGNGMSCSTKFIKIDKTNPSFTTTGDNPGCPIKEKDTDPEYKTWRKGTVKDDVSGIDPNSEYTNYKIGATADTMELFKPATTEKGTKIGYEGFCSGGTEVHIKYNICDMAGNCIKGNNFWKQPPPPPPETKTS